MITTSYPALGSGERHTGLQLRCAASAPRSSASAEYFIRLELGSVLGLDLLDPLVGAEPGMPRHVDGVAARRRMPAERLGERADVVRTGAAAHPEVADPGRVGLAAEVGDLGARTHERVESDREGARIAAARIG